MRRRRGRTHRPVVGLACLASLALIPVTTGGPGTASAAGVSGTPRWPVHPNWQSDVMAPATNDVRPVRLVRTSGAVTGARALIGASGVPTATLTTTAGGPVPTVIVDYGKDVGGVPYFVIHAESRSPVLRSTYSEEGSDIGPRGDMTPSGSGAGDPSRVDNLTIDSSGRFTTGLIQGGERYERISLVSPGTVTLSSIGIRFTAVRATAKQYKGWFASSSAELNRIWYDGAYTTQLDELPAGTIRPPWRVSAGVLDADGGQVGVLGTGHDWTDYTMAFDTRVVDDASDWVVHASSPSSGYLFILHAGAGPKTPASLQAVAEGPGEFAVVGHVTLAAAFDAGSWHHVTTVVSGTHVTTSIDGRQVSVFDTSALPPGASVYPSGTVGFAALGGEAMFRNLAVTAPRGAVLATNALSSSSALADFSGANIRTPDPLPVIMDGAKRDRVVWSGDLGVEGPNVYDTTATDSFVRGSLRFLASFQVTDGEAGTSEDPTTPLGTYPEAGSTYSTSYSMDEVDNIATYVLYTGDLSFLRSQWPMITRELAYNASLVDGRGLLVTDAGDGMDWDYYDGSKTGEVTAYNDIYYETLTDAAAMAEALGDTSQATTYAGEAGNLRSAINRYLLDPTTGLYILSNLEPTAVAQDANSLAVLFGVAPRSADASILAALATTLPSTPYGPLPFTSSAGYRAAVSPFVTNEEVEALFAVGDTTSALSLLRTLWGYMDAPGPNFTGTDWELVGADGAPGFGAYTSLAHGWASGATADLSSDVLGVKPSTAGFATWVVDPHPGTLTWAEGNVPIRSGTIEVRWARNDPAHRFALQVTAPAGTKGTVVVPVPRSGAVVTIATTDTRTHHRSVRSLTSVSGSSSLSVAVKGGATDDIDVTPR